jgi:hypothetical protein
MLNSCLDIFEARMPAKTIGHDFGLLHALDERMAMYGWLTNTGVKLIIVIDMEGRAAPTPEAGKVAILGLRNADLTPVCIPASMRCRIADPVAGISSVADSIHTPTPQSILRPGPA